MSYLLEAIKQKAQEDGKDQMANMKHGCKYLFGFAKGPWFLGQKVEWKMSQTEFDIGPGRIRFLKPNYLGDRRNGYEIPHSDPDKNFAQFLDLLVVEFEGQEYVITPDQVTYREDTPSNHFYPLVCTPESFIWCECHIDPMKHIDVGNTGIEEYSETLPLFHHICRQCYSLCPIGRLDLFIYQRPEITSESVSPA